MKTWLQSLDPSSPSRARSGIYLLPEYLNICHQPYWCMLNLLIRFCIYCSVSLSIITYMSRLLCIYCPLPRHPWIFVMLFLVPLNLPGFQILANLVWATLLLVMFQPVQAGLVALIQYYNKTFAHNWCKLRLDKLPPPPSISVHSVQ